MGVIIYNGVSSEELGIRVSKPPDYVVPQRNYEIVSIPGRSGDIFIDSGVYNNVLRSYDINISSPIGNDSFEYMASKISKWLYSGHGYNKLEDSYDPDYYYLAVVDSETDITNVLQKAGTANIVFNRRPEKFLKIGLDSLQYLSNGEIYNPTSFDSKPIITIKGSGKGTIKINNTTVTINEIGGSITLNTELKVAYDNGTLKNNQVELTDFPILSPGYNTIESTGGITSVSIIPRWWII